MSETPQPESLAKEPNLGEQNNFIAFQTQFQENLNQNQQVFQELANIESRTQETAAPRKMSTELNKSTVSETSLVTNPTPPP